MELEKKITDLQRELNKEAEDKEILQKEVSLLSELKSLPSEVEMLRREVRQETLMGWEWEETMHALTSSYRM